MQGNQLQASIEDRKQEWQIQLASAQQDVLVAAAQVTTANDQLTITTAERDVAALQLDQAKARLKLLLGQFTNAALYKWLSDTLTGIYRYFLQQATATARLAEDQLAFERAETARAFIRADYWEPPSNPYGGDVRGLTGAERLAQDLAKLDEYAFSTDTRRLNMSQTFSLAQLAPMEFLDFRATGQIGFATPSALFDAGFPRPLSAPDPAGPAQRGGAGPAQPGYSRHAGLQRHLPGDNRNRGRVRRGGIAPRPVRDRADLAGRCERRVRRGPAAGHAAAVRGQRGGHYLGTDAAARREPVRLPHPQRRAADHRLHRAVGLQLSDRGDPPAQRRP